MASKTKTALNFNPDIVPVRVYEGDEWFARATIKDSDGVPLDLTAMTIEAKFRAKGEQSSTNLTVVPIDLAVGEFYYGQTAASENGRYDIKIVNNLGVGRSYIRGPITVTADEA